MKTFTLCENGLPLTAERAEEWLVQTVSDPRLCEQNWAELRTIDVALQCAAVLCNPELAQRMWDDLSDGLKFSCIVSSPEKDAQSIRATVRAVMVRYREPEGAAP
jgi:hypothetical protein